MTLQLYFFKVVYSVALEIHLGSRQLPRVLPRQTLFLAEVIIS